MTPHRIELTKDTMCAHDQHEMVNYPRPWFKAKPKLTAGTVLEVKEVWTNFYGSYFRCETADGVYDIPIENAKDISINVQMKVTETVGGIMLKQKLDNLERELDKAYGKPMRKILIKAGMKGWDGLLKILMPICVLIKQIRKGGEKC